MYANERVKIVALAGEDSRDFHYALDMLGFVDYFGLRETAHGYLSGGINMDKLGYMYFRHIKVEPTKKQDSNIILGYN